MIAAGVVQSRMRELGRLRAGEKGSRGEPRKLETFRATSPDRRLVDAFAARYGGDVRAWVNDGRQEWEVVSDSTELPVAIPPYAAATSWSQCFELYGGRTCQRRCDGQWDSVRGVECDCDPDNRQCKLTSRLSLFLPEVPGLGVWRLDSHGWYAGGELRGAVETVERMAPGQMVPARLRLDMRTVRRLGADGKVIKRDFAVPVIDLDFAMGALVRGDVPVPAIASPSEMGAVGELGDGGKGDGWKPVAALPAETPEPMLTVESQLATAHTPPKPRKGAAAPPPATGAAPPTAAQARLCGLCGEDLGEEPVRPNPKRHEGGPRFAHAACVAGADLPAAPAKADGRGGMSGPTTGERSPQGPEPASAVSRPYERMMTAAMHKKVFALLAEAFPSEPGEDGRATDARRKNITLDLAGILGQPGLSSRSEINHQTGMKLINALEAIRNGDFAYVDGNLVDADTGALVDGGGL